MHYLGFLIASVFICKVNAQAPPIERIVKDYFKSQSVRSFRSAWQIHRKAMEHAIKVALAETVGLPGMNVYVRKIKDKLATGYVHDDRQAQVIFMDLNLKSMPRCRLPEVSFSLASNVLTIEAKLSKMIINSNYSLLRNQKDIIYKQKDQNPFENSPFLFVQVDEIGKVALRVDGCKLSGFMITTLTGDSVNLGYDYFKVTDCVYTVEISKASSHSEPVIAKYNLDKDEDTGMSITDLLLRPLLTEELIPKIQAALFSFINASAIFGSKFTEYRDNQEIVFQTTAQYLTELIRNLNRITVEKNGGAIDMEDYTLLQYPGETAKLKGMVLFGLNTMYSAHSGGPYMTDKVMIAEEIRFSSLQVRGTLQATSAESDSSFDFSTEITDLVVDVHLGEGHWDKGYKLIEVKGLRRMSFSLNTLRHASVERMISGYLLNEVPKLIRDHLTDIFPEAVHPNKI